MTRSRPARKSRRPGVRPWDSTVVETLHRNPYFGVLRQRVRLPDGSDTTYFSLDFQQPAVGVVAVHEGRVLLLRQYRFIVDEFVWAIPSGGVHQGETPRAAAARELREETGYKAARLRRLQSFYASYGCSNQVFDIYLAEGLTRVADAFDRNEVIAVRWFTLKSLKSLVTKGKVVDGLSLAPLLLLLYTQSNAKTNVRARTLKPPVASI